MGYFKGYGIEGMEDEEIEKKSSSKKTTKCTKRNPDPPCNEGYEEKLTKKGDNCCYKSSKKTVKQPEIQKKNHLHLH